MVGLTNMQAGDVSAVAGDVTTLLADVAAVDAEVTEIEKHLHNRERWFGKLAVQTATDWADNNLTPFRAISGNNVYGADPNDEALVLGTDDTPIFAGNTRYDAHDLFVVAASSTTVYKLRFVYGTGTMADAIAAEQYSTTMIKIDPAVQSSPAVVHPIMMPRGTCGATQLWVQAWNATDNATIDFFIGVHEYAV
jgi:hypothetical protein